MNVWQKRGLIALCCVVALVLAYGAGRFTGPTKVQTVEVVKTEVKTVEVVKVVEVKAKAQVVYVDRVVTKEGEIRERIVTKTVERETKTDNTKTKEVTKEDSHKETVTLNDAPRLTVSLLAGVDLQPAWQPIPNAGPLALGASVTYRIAGPFTVGAWGVHTGAFGISLGAQF